MRTWSKRTETGSTQEMKASEPLMRPLVNKRRMIRTVCSAAVFFTVMGANYATESAMSAPNMVASDACTIERCVTDGGYAIEIISNEKPKSKNLIVGDTKAVNLSNDRVDIYGNFMVRMQNGGVVWATEDPAVLEPRLGMRGPLRLPIKDSNILDDAKFDVTLNYPAFVKRMELLIFDGNDDDLVSPVYKASRDALTPTQTYVQFNVDRAELSKLSVFSGDELFYIVRAYDAKGRMDETTPKVIQVMDLSQFEPSQQDRYLKVPNRGRATPAFIGTNHLQSQGNANVQSKRQVVGKMSAGDVSSTPLNGAVLVMQPGQVRQVSQAPRTEMRQTARNFTLTPKFGTRKINLRSQDKRELDNIINQLRSAQDLNIRVVGHTDNVRIAPQNRKEFANNHVLSEARAKVVADYLARGLNLSGSQVSRIGAGPDQPVASNKTADGRQQNRRVELQITGKFPTQVQVAPAVTRSVTTSADKVTLVDPSSNISEVVDNSLEAAENLLSARTGRPVVSRKDYSSASNAIDNEAGSVPTIIAPRVSENDLRLQNIPVYGSRVRLAGQDVADNYRVLINDVSMPLDEYGKFAYEYIMPVGQYNFDVSLLGPNGQQKENGQLNLDVTGKHMFMVALADVNVGQNDIKGSLEPLSVDDEFDESVFVNGRLAFYLKGKTKGKYLITAQMDTTEEEIGDIFKNIHRKDARSVFRRLDPDRYYPVYGDDSTTYSDTDSQGRMYLRVDWDKSRALWGNYNTGVTGTEFGQYNRSLYGAKIDYRSLNTTELGEAKNQVNAFVSEAQSALGHSQFIGTGGSLYYLRHRDILPGSDKVRVEIRDRDSERVIENVTLYRGADYEIDELQGRIILSRPLTQITQEYVPSLIQDNPLDGNRVYLLADYEYVPDAFDADNLTAGVRGKKWFGDHIGLGVAYVDENRSSGDDYQLASADLTLQAGKGTYVKFEATRTENSQAQGRFLSDDGGLSFIDDSSAITDNQEGTAIGMNARVNFKERGWTDKNWKAGAWWRRVDDNYSSSRRNGNGTDVYEYGAEMVGEISDRLRISARGAVIENESLNEDRRYGLQLDYQLSDRTRISGEVARREESSLANNFSTDATLAALQVSYSLSSHTDVYLKGQATLSADASGTTTPLGFRPEYDNNDLVTIGAKHRINEKANIQAEYSKGHRGDAATVGLEYRVNSNHQVYGNYTHSTDTTERTLAENQFTLGHRSRISDQVSVHNESQFVNETEQAGLTHVFGLNYVPKKDWRFGLSYQNGDLDRITTAGESNIDRQALTLSGGYQTRDLQWSTSLEFRKDDIQGANAEQLDQWITSNRLDYKVNDSLRVLGKATYSETDDDTERLAGQAFEDAKFAEASVGLAYRPVNDNRWNTLVKYTYLYDLPVLSQDLNGLDQRSNILAAETIHRLNQRWSVGGKGVWKRGELRERRNGGSWYESDTRFAALRGRYHLTNNWDGLLEYRWLNVQEDDSTRHGLLMSIDRHIGQNFKVGVGYNFTDFSDDLRETDYDNHGWFINLVGKY